MSASIVLFCVGEAVHSWSTAVPASMLALGVETKSPPVVQGVTGYLAYLQVASFGPAGTPWPPPWWLLMLAPVPSELELDSPHSPLTRWIDIVVGVPSLG